MKLEFTRKIYHGKYDHRLVVKTRYYTKQDKSQPTGEVVEWLMSNKFKKGTWKGLSSTSYIRDQSSYTVYFKGSEPIEFLKNALGEKWIDIVEKPLDDDHAEMLQSNDKLVTRKTLFYGKYRMCLRVSPERLTAWQTSSQNIREIKAWCQDQFAGDAERVMISGYSRGNFYFADPKDALLFKLTWGGQDVKTERVITVAELEAAQATKVA